ncbi:MAG: DUF4339 domain-containing protein [Bdellovibrionales bacterium]|nr:DUF4339 domain-containing protein [Bdellovibrionales bacterium]
MAKWFTFHNERIEGPFSTDELKQKVQLGSVSSEALVWGQAQSDWKPLSWWHSNLDELLSRLQNNFDDRLWHYAMQGQSYGPMSRKQLVSELKKVTGDPNSALIWTKGMPNWAPIHEFHDLMDEVGVNRRAYPRAPIEGKVIINLSESQTIIGQLKTISEGGFGALNVSGLVAGTEVAIEIQSESMPTVHATAQVRYVSESQFAGFKFSQINREAISRIVSYVKGAEASAIRQVSAA